MKRSTHPINQQYGLLFYLSLLTGLFILLEMSFFIQASDIYLGDFFLISKKINIPPQLLIGLLFFIIVQLSLHAILVFVIWLQAKGLGFTFSLSTNRRDFFGFVLWFIAIITILLANQNLFPNSKFAGLFNHFINHSFAQMVLYCFSSILLIVSLFAVYGWLKMASSKIIWLLSGFIFILPISFYLVSQLQTKSIQDAATLQKPNIILIGIDSLRPDFVGFFNGRKMIHNVSTSSGLKTPYMDEFLNQAVVFSAAYTPLARTFPAWVSILTGQYPKESGVRFNLPKIIQFNWQQSLGHVLKKQGYSTLFATDEVRFSNIDQRFGFEKVVSPPIGANDFLIGDLTDFPLQNLLVNSRLGQWLFPYSFANRPVFVTYDPNSFLNLLKNNIPAKRSKPLFLAVHFCLPHYPYFWGKLTADEKPVNNYRASIERVDQQFSDFLRILNHYQLLNHALVILLSDHGEAIELPGDRVTEANLFIPGKNNPKSVVPHFYPPSFDDEKVNESAGHGTDVLGLTQYHIVLAVKTFHLKNLQPTIKSELVSLLNIKPTILNYLQMSSLRKPLIYFNDIQVKSKTDPHFFIESDFSPQALRTVHPETRQLLKAGIDYFQIDSKTNRIHVKNSMANLIISSKQYADIYGKWILALYPQQNRKMIPILVNLENGYWTDDLTSEFAKGSPADKMLSALQRFYLN